MSGEPVKITLTFSPLAFAILEVMACDNETTVEECIIVAVANDVGAWGEAVGRKNWEAPFLPDVDAKGEEEA